MVDLPDADRPVSQMVRPFWLSWALRSARVRAAAWKVMFLLVLEMSAAGESESEEGQLT